MSTSIASRAIGTLAIATHLLFAGFVHAAPTASESAPPVAPAAAVTSRLPVRFHLAALRESPLKVYRATLLDGDAIGDNVFTNLNRIDGLGRFASIKGQRSFAMRLSLMGGSQDAFVILTATDRRCAAVYNTAAAQNLAGGAPDREYEISSIVTSNLAAKRSPAGVADLVATSDTPVKSFARTFCAAENARFDVTFNAAGPKAIPVVVSTLSATDDGNILNRFVWFLVI